ncbi:MAG: hypothetical protein AAF914_10915 [Pseudomonadota bacterium]
MRSTRFIALAAASLLALSGCINSDLERAGAGALVGGLATAAVNGNVATGVLVGGVGGALCDDVGLC